MDFAGKTAVVTGGSGALCSEFCKALAAAGARVAVIGSRRETAETVVQEILAAGGTDTSAMQMSGAGVKAAALSIPTRYIHSGVEMLDLNDAEACVELTVAWLKK